MIEVNTELQKFIEDNIQLIEENTELSWSQVYTLLNDAFGNDSELSVNIGQFTELMLSIHYDPLDHLTYVPKNYLSGSTLTEYTIPEHIKEIDPFAFNHSDIKSIVVPEGCTIIRDHAFYGCRNLSQVILPDSVEAIEYNAFSYTNLKNVKLPDNMKVLDEIFYESSLEELTLPRNLRLIKDYAFGYSNVRKIIYKGTTQEWKWITKEESWDYGSDSEPITLICSDGDYII